MPPKNSVLAQAKARAQELVQQRAAAASKLHRSSAAALRASPSPPVAAAAVGKRKRVGGPDAEAVAVAAAVAPRSTQKKAKQTRAATAIVSVADSGDEDDSIRTAQGSHTSKGEPSRLELQSARPRVTEAGHETLTSKPPQQNPQTQLAGAPASSSDEDDRDDEVDPRATAPHPSRPIRPQPGLHAPRPASTAASAEQISQDFKVAQPSLRAASSAISVQQSSLPDFELPFAPQGSARRSRPLSARQPQGALESDAPRDDVSSTFDALARPHGAGKCARLSSALSGHPRSAFLLIVLTAIAAALTARWLASPAMRSTYGVARAISSEVSLAVGEALCHPGTSLLAGDGRSLACSAVVERLRSRGEAFAADALARAARGDVISGLQSALGDSGVELRGDKTLVAGAVLAPRKSWACWLRQDVTSFVQSGIARGAEFMASGLLLITRIFWNLILVYPAVSLGVAVALFATVGFALYRRSVRARNLVVDTMFDCALRELEALAGRAIPLAQLRPHVMDRLYNGPFSVMALRAVRHWPRVEARLKLDSRVHVDAVAETAAGLIQPCATWVSPLRLGRGRP